VLEKLIEASVRRRCNSVLDCGPGGAEKNRSRLATRLLCFIGRTAAIVAEGQPSLSSLALVAMVKSSDLGNRHNTPEFWFLHDSRPLERPWLALNVFSNAGSRQNNFAGSGAQHKSRRRRRSRAKTIEHMDSLTLDPQSRCAFLRSFPFPQLQNYSSSRLDGNPVIHGRSNPLPAAKVTVGRLNRDGPQCKLTLLQLTYNPRRITGDRVYQEIDARSAITFSWP
jgi:hypothetical protein